MRTSAVATPSKHDDPDPMLEYRWALVYDADPTLSQHWVNVSPLLRGVHSVSAWSQIDIEDRDADIIDFQIPPTEHVSPTSPQCWPDVEDAGLAFGWRQALFFNINSRTICGVSAVGSVLPRDNWFRLGSRHLISRGGGGVWRFCPGQIIYFNPARWKFQILLHIHIP